jgi:SHS2 domain-containing protein
MGGFEILEHTADIGLAATGATLEEVFEQATLGLGDIIGIRARGAGDVVEVELLAPDVPSLLVDWLSEFLWLHESRSAALASVDVDRVAEGRVAGRVGLRPIAVATGIHVKAVTYHQLSVERHGERWRATVFFDV